MKELDIKTYYDTISPTYDELYAREQLKKYMEAYDFIANMNDRVLDAGCGTLLLEEYLYHTRLIERVDYIIALDLSLKMIEKGLARINMEKFPFEKLDVIIADASRMPFRDKVFLYTCAFSLLNKALWKKIWTEITRVTRKTILFTFITDEDTESVPSECTYQQTKVGKEVLCIYHYTIKEWDKRKARNGGKFVGRTDKE